MWFGIPVPGFWGYRSPKCAGKFHLCWKISLYVMMPYLELDFAKSFILVKNDCFGALYDLENGVCVQNLLVRDLYHLW
jgi:hypothetical protein